MGAEAMTVRLPRSVAYEVTYRCNHRCLFCSCPWYAPESRYHCGNELDVEQWNRVTDLLIEKGVVSFSISGGEALMKEGLIDILSHIHRRLDEHQLKSPIVLISNGRLVNEQWLRAFHDLGVHLSMSLPGYSTFKFHTGVDNADGVLEMFRQAKAIGLTTTANITVTKQNLHELFETASIALINGAGSILLNRFLPGGRGLSNIDQLLLSRQEINEMLSVCEEVLALANRYGNVGTEIPLCVIDNPDSLRHLHVGYRCAAAKGFFVVDPSGQLRTCNHSPHVVGHVFSEPMISDVQYWNMFQNSDFKPSVCKGCDDILRCDCGCREVANILCGDPTAADNSIF